MSEHYNLDVHAVNALGPMLVGLEFACRGLELIPSGLQRKSRLASSRLISRHKGGAPFIYCWVFRMLATATAVPSRLHDARTPNSRARRDQFDLRGFATNVRRFADGTREIASV